MKRERLFTFLEAAITGFLLSLTATACMVTAFSMDGVSFGTLAFYCLLGSMFCGYLCSRRLDLLMLGLTALCAGILWQSELLLEGLESLLYTISRFYHDAYGWKIVQWGWRDPEEMALTLAPFIYILGGFIAIVTAWTICRGQSSIVACVPAVLPVAACFIVTDTIPDLLWLILFLTVIVVMILTSSTRQVNRAHGRQLALYTLLPTFLAVGILFLAIPQSTYYHRAQAQTISDFLLGKYTLEQMLEQLAGNPVITAEKKVDLTKVGVRFENRTKILEVTSRQNGGPLYLRTSAMDRYTGTQWLDSETDISDLYWPEIVNAAGANEVHIKTQFAHEMLYLPYYPYSLDITGMTRGIENTKKLNEYSVTQVIREAWEVMYEEPKPVTTNQRLEMSAMTRLPEDTKDWAADLAQSIVGDQTDPYYQALAIAGYVKNSARYDQNTNTMPANREDFAQWFLEESDTGYCVHFATAGAVLLKALGIPARYVTGYLVEVKAGTPQNVLASDAHAWVEYWLPGFGWTILECTPSATEESNPVQQPDATTPTAQTPTTPQATPDKPATSALQEKTSDLGWVWWLITIAGFAMVMVLQRKLRLLIRKKRRQRGNPNAQALIRWAEAERFGRYLGQTPPEALRTLAEKAKFSPYTLRRDELAQFDRYLLHSAGQLQKKNIFCRLWYQWILVLY